MALDESPSYTEALAAWLASNCQDESQLLQGKALEDAKELVGCQSLSEQDYQFLIASQELEKRELLKQLEIAQQKTQSLATNRQIVQQFLGSLPNELRTHLNGVICSLRIIIDGLVDDDPEAEREFIDAAHHSALHLLDVIDNLLDVAKIEVGKFSVELTPIRLYELLAEVEKSVQTQAQAQKKQLNLQIIRSATQYEIITYGDYYRLRQVMLTLVGDAIKYTNEGGITIDVEIIEQKVMLQNQEHPGLVKIHVADAWSKYSQDSLLRLLQQMNDSSIYQWYFTPAFGLAISKKLIEAMSGELHLAVKGEGRGATVTISLPLYQEPAMT